MAIRCDDNSGVSMECFHANNGDWYLTLYETDQRPRTMRFSTSGSQIPLYIILKIAELGRIMDKMKLNGCEIVETSRYRTTELSSFKEDRANAQLMASAPDMYHALKELIEKTEELATIVHLITKEQGDAIKQAKEVIKKATSIPE